MSDLDQRPIKDQWKIVTDQDDASLMTLSLNGQEFDVQAFGLGKQRTDGKTMMKIQVLIDLDQLKIGDRRKTKTGEQK